MRKDGNSFCCFVMKYKDQFAVSAIYCPPPLSCLPPPIGRTGAIDGGIGAKKGERGLVSSHSPRVREGCHCMCGQGLSRPGEAAKPRCRGKADRLLCLPSASQREKSCGWASLPASGGKHRFIPFLPDLQKVGTDKL